MNMTSVRYTSIEAIEPLSFVQRAIKRFLSARDKTTIGFVLARDKTTKF